LDAAVVGLILTEINDGYAAVVGLILTEINDGSPVKKPLLNACEGQPNTLCNTLIGRNIAFVIAPIVIVATMCRLSLSPSTPTEFPVVRHQQVSKRGSCRCGAKRHAQRRDVRARASIIRGRCTPLGIGAAR
jgi:hypothetical protein